MISKQWQVVTVTNCQGKISSLTKGELNAKESWGSGGDEEGTRERGRRERRSGRVRWERKRGESNVDRCEGETERVESTKDGREEKERGEIGRGRGDRAEDG